MNDLLGQAVRLKEAQVRDSRAKWYSLPRAVRETVYRCIEAPAASPSSTSPLLRYISDQQLISSVIEKKCSFLIHKTVNHNNNNNNNRNDDHHNSQDDDDSEVTNHQAQKQQQLIEFSSDVSKCLAYSHQFFERAKTLHQNEQLHREARERYADAMSVFCFVVPTKRDWSKKGFADDDLLFFLSSAATSHNAEINSVVVKAQLGIAICSFKLGEFSDCVEQCKFVLDRFDAASLQAAFWCARAMTENRSQSGAVDTENAIEILKKTLSAYDAAQTQESAEARNERAHSSSSQRQEALKLLAKLESERKQNDAKGKKLFSKLFDEKSEPLSSSPATASRADSRATPVTCSISQYESSWKVIQDEAIRRCGEDFVSTIAKSPNAASKTTTTQLSLLVPLTNLARELIASACSSLCESCKKVVRAGGFTTLRTMLTLSDYYLHLHYSDNNASAQSLPSSSSPRSVSSIFNLGEISHLGAVVSSVRDAVGKFGYDVDRILSLTTKNSMKKKSSNDDKFVLDEIRLLEPGSGERERVFCETLDRQLEEFWRSHDVGNFSYSELICELAALRGCDDNDDDDDDDIGEGTSDDLERLKKKLIEKRSRLAQP